MKKMQQAKPEFTTDADGQQLVHVAMAHTQMRATLYAEDYHRLMALGFSPHWQFTQDGRGSAYVTLTAYTSDGHNRVIPVARLITGAGHGERVRAIDGNTLNLRSDNLTFYAGRAWFHASDWYPTADAARAAGVAVKKRERKASAPTATQAAETVAQRKPRSRLVRPTESAGTPRASSEPAAPFTAGEVNCKAIAQRVREQVARGAEQVAEQG